MGAIASIDVLGIGTSIEITTQHGERIIATGVAVNTLPSNVLPIALFVDPQNSTGFANDANTGQTATNVPAGSGPILTTAQNNTRMNAGGAGLTAHITVTYLSEDAGSIGLNYRLLNLNGFNLDFVGGVVALNTGGTITTVTAIAPTAPAGGQRERLQVSNFVDWTPYIVSAHGLGGSSAVPTRVQDLTHNASAWVMSQETGEVTFGHLSQPTTDDGTTLAQFTVADSFRVVRPFRLPVEMAPTPLSSNGGLVSFTNFQVHTTGESMIQASTFAQVTPTWTQCSFDGPLLVGGQFNSCFFLDGMQGEFFAGIFAGGLLPNSGTDQQFGALYISGNLYVTGDSSFTVGGTFYQAVFIFAAPNQGLQIQSVSGSVPGFDFLEGGTLVLGGLLWGNGNSGAGLLISPGAVFTTMLTTPNITGATGDFAFLFNGTVSTTARAWDDSVGAYTASRATSWANYNLAIAGGGFGHNAHCVQSMAAVITS